VVCKLLKALYRLKQSPRLWQEKLRFILSKLGFEPLEADNYMYYNKDTKFIIITYIDDFLVIALKGPTLDEFKIDLSSKLDVKDLREASYFLRVRIT